MPNKLACDNETLHLMYDKYMEVGDEITTIKQNINDINTHNKLMAVDMKNVVDGIKDIKDNFVRKDVYILEQANQVSAQTKTADFLNKIIGVTVFNVLGLLVSIIWFLINLLTN